MIGKLRAALVRSSKILSRKGLYEFLGSQFSAIPAGARVLSVGSGGDINKRLRQHAASSGLEIVEFDIDPDRRPDIVGDICHHDFGDRRFDVVVISEVLEHLHSPHLALANIRSILVENGRLVLTTPFIFPIHEAPYDYYRYTKYGLAFLLKDFRDVVIQERNSFFETVDVLWVRLAQAGSRSAQIASLMVIPLIFLKWPLTWLLSRLVRTDVMTTGYTVTALR